VLPGVNNSSMFKVELHAHTSDDPHDHIPHSTPQLIDRAASLGYGALAITLHDRQLDIRQFHGHAAKRGVVLIPGIERTIFGKHVLLLNFGPDAEEIDSFETLAAVKETRPAGLVVAPHPFYPGRTCLGRRLLDTQAHLFDAVEFNAFYTSTINVFNDTAVRWAKEHGKPIVANADVHRLWQLDKTYSLVDAAPYPDAICKAIRAGNFEIRTTPMSAWRAASHLFALLVDEASYRG
jgi:predicted metal-dependent phosphoesterase TrpH